MTVDDTPQAASLGDGWVTVAEAARLLGKSESFIRRKLKTEEFNGQLAHDPEIGSKRWMIEVASMEVPREARNVLVPIEAIDRLEEAWGRLRDAVARAEIAERIAEFEKQRRQTAEEEREAAQKEREAAEKERDRLRELLEGANYVSDRVAELEKQRRLEVEQERDRLRAIITGEQEKKRSWLKLWLD